MESLEQQFSENLSLTTSRHETQSSNPIPGKPKTSIPRPRLFFTVEVDGKLFFYASPQPQNPNDNSSLVATPYQTSLPKYVPTHYCTPVYGLVLLQGLERKMRVICNPLTGEFLTLPKVLLKEKNLPKVKAKSNPDSDNTKEKIAGMYFGYDPIGQQFKVLCMTSSRVETPNTHQVLTLESGKRLWRRIEHKFHFVKDYKICGEICINGVLYFGAELGKSSMIVSFDVRTERFSFINTDKDMAQEGRPCIVGSLTLFNYKGELGIRHRDSRFRQDLVLWSLEDAGNHKWSKHIYVLSPLAKSIVNYRFAGMTGTGEIVCVPYNGPSNLFTVFLYNLETNTLARVNIHGSEEFKHPRIRETFLDYVEHLNFM